MAEEQNREKNHRLYIRLDEETIRNMQRIRISLGLKSQVSAIEAALNNYFTHQDMQQMLIEIKHQNTLIKSYLNEQRRKQFITNNLLNAIAIHLGINTAPRHDIKQFKSAALLETEQCLKTYLNEIATLNRQNNASRNDKNE